MIIVFGGQGFIGYNFCLNLQKTKQNYISIDIKKNFEDKNLILTKEPFFTLEEILKKNKGVTGLINCAGSPGVGFSNNNLVEDYNLNVNSVFKLLNILKNNSSKSVFVQLSSAAVYGEPNILPIDENTEIKPISPYGFHKYIAEEIISEFYNLFGLNFIILRLFSCYGPHLKKQLFWDIWKKQNKESKSINLFGSGAETRDFIFIDDVCKIITVLLESQKARNQIYNLGTGVETSIKEASTLFVSMLGNKKVKFTGEEKSGDPNNWRSDISKLQAIKEFDFTNLINGLQLTSNWIKNE